MSNSKILTGLQLSEYIHPSEARFRGKDPQDTSLVEKGMSALNDLSVELLSRITMGKYVLVNSAMMPELFNLLDDVCRILDYHDAPPKLYIRHERSLTVAVGGTDKTQFLIPDYIIQHFDQSMLYYTFGNAITMLKAGHVKLATICSVLCETAYTKPFVLILEACMRAADLTSDRGGLLCCQSFAAAARCHLAETGVPLHVLQSLDDEETEELVRTFLDETQDRHTNLITDVAAFLKKLNWSDSPAFIRVKELYDWYQSDYRQVIARRGGEC